LRIFREDQDKYYRKEMEGLTKVGNVPGNSPLMEMNPKIDENGLMRANSRLMNAAFLDWETRFPVILHKDSWITWLLIGEQHKRDGHYGGVDHCLSGINCRFWIRGVRSVIKRYVKECLFCQRERAKGGSQIMAPLPSFRVIEPGRPFVNVAVDYAGPVSVKIGRGKVREKRYICIFSCLQTRAVHLEVAQSLETDAFLRVFTRMISRRGRPKLMISDNGTNFVGVLKTLKDVVERAYNFDCLKVNSGITWIFNPPGTPHFNGVCEIMVKLMKRVLGRILKKAEMTDEELNTVIVRVEGILNSRPICRISQDPKDENALTPNCFLRGGLETGEQDLEPADTASLRLRWRRVQELTHHFWKRWRRELVVAWRKRSKWKKEMKPLEKGELVWLLDSKDDLGKWRLARVTKVFEGADQRVRVVEVLADGKRMIKNITQISPLELRDCSDSPASNQGGEDVPDLN